MRNRTSELRISCFDALPLSHARDMTKNIFLCFFTELKTYHLSYCIHKHDAIDIADPSCMQGASHMNFVVHFAHRRVSAVPQWLSIGARNSWVWGLIPHGNSEFFLCLMLVTRQKTSFSISYPSSKLTISVILLTVIIFSMPRKFLEHFVYHTIPIIFCCRCCNFVLMIAVVILLIIK